MVSSEDVCRNIRNVKLNEFYFPTLVLLSCLSLQFCALFRIKLRWPKEKNIYSKDTDSNREHLAFLCTICLTTLV